MSWIVYYQIKKTWSWESKRESKKFNESIERTIIE